MQTEHVRNRRLVRNNLSNGKFIHVSVICIRLEFKSGWGPSLASGIFFSYFFSFFPRHSLFRKKSHFESYDACSFLFEEKERLSGDKFLMLNPTSSAVKKVVQKFRVFPTQIFTSTRVWYTLFWRTSTICLWGTGLTAYSRHYPSLYSSRNFSKRMSYPTHPIE